MTSRRLTATVGVVKTVVQAGWRSPGFDAVLAAATLAVSLVLASSAGRGQAGTRPMDGLAYVTVLGSCGLLTMRRRFPLQVAGTVGVGLLLVSVREYPGGPLLVPVMIALYSVGTTQERRAVLLAGVAATAVVVMRAWATTAAHGQVSAFTWAAPGWVIASLVWGAAVRSRRQTIEALRQRVEEAERTREQEAALRVADERLRIARDLHDVIGHSFTTVNVQARVAATLLQDAPDRARQALEAIEAISRDALREIRQALSLQREGELGTPDRTRGATSRAGTAQIGQLLGPLRTAGLTVDATIQLPRRPIPVVVDAAVYRIVQEALTNVLRHAAASHVTLRISADGHGMQVKVADDGTGSTPPPLGGTGASSDRTGGHGIEGMRERALALGGHLDAGPLPGRGFAVTAYLPVAG
jgi:signal transduction histidine kinase